jgi:hypothetical protein
MEQGRSRRLVKRRKIAKEYRHPTGHGQSNLQIVLHFTKHNEEPQDRAAGLHHPFHRQRLCNMTTLIMGSFRVYHPDYPRSEVDKWRYEIWKQVMDYCHQIGMKFNWWMTPTLVMQEAFWDNPDKRADQEGGCWYSNGLSWPKGKEEILRIQRYTLEYFRDMDGLELMYTDGGGFSFDDATASDPTGYFADSALVT